MRVKSQLTHLMKGGFHHQQAWSERAMEHGAQAVRMRHIAGAQSTANQRQALTAFEQQAVTHEPRAFAPTTFARQQASPNGAKRAAIKVVDSHVGGAMRALVGLTIHSN